MPNGAHGIPAKWWNTVLAEFTIHELDAGGGILAISPLPGRSRHYATDFNRLLDWAPAMVITMCSLAELERKGSGGLGEDCAACGIDWAHVPVEDFGVPVSAEDWPEVSRRARTHLTGGGKVLCHCFGGCGRSGMAALRIMVELGEPPDTALRRLRQVRPCAVETGAQYEWAAMGGVHSGG